MRLGVYRIQGKKNTGKVYGFILEAIRALVRITDRQVIFIPDNLEDIYKEQIEIEGYPDVHVVPYPLGQKMLPLLLEWITPDIDMVLFTGDQVFGPVYALDDIICDIENSDHDIWGLFENPMTFSDVNGVTKECLFDGFFAIKDKILHSDMFSDLIKASYLSSVDEYENLLLQLRYAGEKWDTYVKHQEYRGRLFTENVNNEIYYAYDMVHFDKVPYISWKVLINTYFLPGGDEVPYRTFRYVKEHTSYDTDLIWEYLLDTENILDIKNALHMEITLPSECVTDPSLSPKGKKCVVLSHLYYPDHLEECMDFLSAIPKEMDVVILTANNELEKNADQIIKDRKLDNFTVLRKRNRGRDFSALLIAAEEYIRTYDYICFVHDKKSHSGSPVASGRTWMYFMWASLLKSEAYIRNIISLFEKEKRLGMLTPPEPFHSEAIAGIGFTWAEDHRNVCQLAEEFDLQCDLSPEKHPFILGATFWCRREALEPLFQKKWLYKDFPDEPMPIDGTVCHALERLLPYVAQSQGYYSSYVMDNEIASMRASKISHYLGQTMTIMREDNIWDRQDGGVTFNREKKYHPEYALREIKQFLDTYDEIYIYGAGKYGKACLDILKAFGRKPKSFVVTKNNGKKRFNYIPVIEYKELKKTRNTGIIVAVKRQFAMEVIPMLLNDGFDQFMTYTP